MQTAVLSEPQYTLLIKVLENCPNRDKVVDYYRNKINSTSYSGDSGVDLIMPTTYRIQTNDVLTCGLGIACELLPRNSHQSVGFMIVPRSSIKDEPIMLTHSVGIIDAGYRGELKAPFRCFVDRRHPTTINDFYYETKPDSRFVQIIAPDLLPIKIQLVDQLSDTERGTRGFGSTNQLQTSSTPNNNPHLNLTMLGQ